MRDPSCEALFERWRSAGDLDAMAAVFDRTAPGLLALAAHLAREPAEAEDLVQDTFLAALEHARAFDRSRRLEPWLAGILVRLARKSRRTRARRPDPERLGRAPVAEPPAELERRELDAALASALDDVEEPYRSVLERHLRGERALDIAKTSGRAPGTVRMQILRGLERLRRILPAGLYGLAPLEGGQGLGALREAVLARASASVAATAATTSTAISIGGTTMTATTKVACGALAVAALAFALHTARAGAASRGEAGGSAAARADVPLAQSERAVAPVTAVTASRDGALEPSREEAPGEPPPAPAPREAGADGQVWLEGALLGLASEPEAALLRVVNEDGLTTEARGAADGTYRIEVTPFVRGDTVKALHAYGEHPSGRRARLELALDQVKRHVAENGDETIEAELVFAPATAVIGRVRGEGLDFASVKLALVPPHDSHDGCFADGTCDEQGRFALFPPCSGPLRLVAAAPGVLPLCVEIEVEEGSATDVGALALDQRGAAIEGRIVSSLEPLATDPSLFAVRARRRGRAAPSTSTVFDGVQLTADGARVAESVAGLRVDGFFRIEGLEPGEYALELDAGQSSYLVPAFAAAEAVAPASGVTLGEHYGIVEIVPTGLEPGASVRVTAVMQQQTYTSSRHTSGEPVLAIADRRGKLEIEATASEGGKVERESAAGTRSELERIVLDLGGAAPAVEVTWIPNGVEPPKSVRALCAGALIGDTTPRLKSGGCTLPNLPPGRTRIVLEAGNGAFADPSGEVCVPSFEVDVIAGRTARVDVAWTAGGRARVVPEARESAAEFLRARVLDSAGIELPVRFARRELGADGPANSFYGNSVPLDAPTELEPMLPPGAYTLVLSDMTVELLRVPFSITAGATTDVRFVAP